MAFFPLMPFGVITVSTIVLAIVSCIVFRNQIGNNFKERKRYIAINILFFIFIIFSAVYAENITVSINEIRRDLNLLIFPLIILVFFPKINRIQLINVINSYLSATTILLLIYIIIIIRYGYDNRHIKSLFDYPYRDIIEGKSHMKVTPTYLSLWFSFSIFCILSKLNSITTKTSKIILVFLAVSFYLFIFLIAARMVFLTLNVLLIALLFYNYKAKMSKKIMILTSLVLLLCMVSYKLSHIKSFKQRYYNEFFIKKIKTPKGRNPSSLSIRYGIYNCGISLIKSAPFLGYGVGDVQDELNKCYKSSYRSSFYKKKKFDSHNFYVFLMLSGGVLTLLSFIVMAVCNLKIGFNTQDLLYVGFIFLVLFCCLTENILNRVYGTVFFAFFNAIFLLKNVQNIRS